MFNFLNYIPNVLVLTNEIKMLSLCEEVSVTANLLI